MAFQHAPDLPPHGDGSLQVTFHAPTDVSRTRETSLRVPTEPIPPPEGQQWHEPKPFRPVVFVCRVRLAADVRSN